jgi:hypothetical protein
MCVLLSVSVVVESKSYQGHSGGQCNYSHRYENNHQDSADQHYVIHGVTGHRSTRLVCALNNAIVFDVRHSRIFLARSSVLRLTRINAQAATGTY